MSTERFGSRYALIAAAIGMAVGTGNLWRFPRVAAEWGGGTFLIVVVAASVIWAIPLLITESLLGSKSRLGTIGAFRDFMGPKFAWMGGFMALVTVGILCYYSVVCGWALRYIVLSLTGTFSDRSVNTQSVWDGFIDNPAATIGFHLVAIVVVGAIVFRGLKGGFEGVLKVALPALFVVLVILVIRAVSLPGAGEGMEHLFAVDPADFGEVRVWLEAFTQVAFSTGAGWGLYLTYAVYSRSREDMAGNATILTVGDLVAALLAGVAVLCTLFALSSSGFASDAIGATNEGLAFVYFTRLFVDMPAGSVFAVLFFLALALAGLSSLIAMVEMATRNVMNMGVARRPAVIGVVAFAFVFGLPSALSLDVFSNQDFVWGVGLLVNGLLAALAMMKYGVDRARQEIVATASIPIGGWWAWCIRLFPVVFAVLLAWWIYQAVVDFAPDTWWNPLDPFSLATLILQWGVVFVLTFALNGVLARAIEAGPMSQPAGSDDPERADDEPPPQT